jgi:hypothetical protein
MKAELTLKIFRLLKARHLTQTEAAKLLQHHATTNLRPKCAASPFPYPSGD